MPHSPTLATSLLLVNEFLSAMRSNTHVNEVFAMFAWLQAKQIYEANVQMQSTLVLNKKNTVVRKLVQ